MWKTFEVRFYSYKSLLYTEYAKHPSECSGREMQDFALIVWPPLEQPSRQN